MTVNIGSLIFSKFYLYLQKLSEYNKKLIKILNNSFNIKRSQIYKKFYYWIGDCYLIVINDILICIL